MKLVHEPLPGLLVLEMRYFRDERGFFAERFRAERLRELGVVENFVQDNHSRSAPGVLRGLHYQTDPKQGKLVSVLRGSVYDVAVDLRRKSPSYGQHYGLELSEGNGLVLYVPPGFAHGFCVTGEEDADLIYKVTGYYNAASEGGVRWDDPELGIRWPCKEPLLSPRDLDLPLAKGIKLDP